MFPAITSSRIYFAAIMGIVLLALSGMVVAADNSGPSSAAPVPVDRNSPAYDIKNTTRLQWIAPAGQQPVTYADWHAQHGVTGPLEIKLANHAAPIDKEDAVRFAVIVNSDLYQPLSASLELYTLDLAGEGYDVTTYYMSGGTPESFRTFLQSKYADGLMGCLLIGDLPVPWYETADEQFPIDLFFMDMDGAFGDADADADDSRRGQ
jgi:hypothetical protein